MSDSLPLESVDSGHGWVVFPQGLKLPRGADQGQLPPVLCPGPPIMSYIAICRWILFVLGFKIPGRGQAANKVQLLFVPGLKPLCKRYRACHSKILLIREILESLKYESRQGICMEKPTGNSIVVPTSLVGPGLRQLPGQGECVSQVGGDSDTAPTCQLWRWGGMWLSKGTMASVSTSVWEIVASSSVLVLKPNYSLPSHMFLCFSRYCLDLRASLSLCVIPLRGTPEALRFTQPQLSLVFTARSCRDFSS